MSSCRLSDLSVKKLKHIDAIKERLLNKKTYDPNQVYAAALTLNEDIVIQPENLEKGEKSSTRWDVAAKTSHRITLTRATCDASTDAAYAVHVDEG